MSDKQNRVNPLFITMFISPGEGDETVDPGGQPSAGGGLGKSVVMVKGGEIDEEVDTPPQGEVSSSTKKIEACSSSNLLQEVIS